MVAVQIMAGNGVPESYHAIWVGVGVPSAVTDLRVRSSPLDGRSFGSSLFSIQQ